MAKTKTDISGELKDKIIVKGARTHNLKNVTVEMPRNKMVVFTGLSGSGKSSLAFDTIFAEGQRRYVESLSSYARQFLRQMQKPDVDEIIGLSPAISIDQKSRSNNPRSNVATITEIYDYLRILYARVGKPHCMVCGREIKRLSHEEIMGTILETIKSIDVSEKEKKVMGVAYNDLKLSLYSPIIVGRKGEYYQLLYDLLGKGYEKVKVDGQVKKLREQIVLDKNKKHSIDVLVDEIYLSEFTSEENHENSAEHQTKSLSRKKNSSLFTQITGSYEPKNFSHAAGSRAESNLNTNTKERLSEGVEKALNESNGLLKIESPAGEKLISSKFMCPYDGFSYPEIEPRLFSFNSPYGACQACNGLGTKYFMGDEICPVCKGTRLREEALHVFVEGTNIADLISKSIADSFEFFGNLKLTPKEKSIAKVVLKEIEARLIFMIDVGIDYLTLSRRANTLSGGEAQRIRLASQLGSGLVGALYVLDEPTIGLHQRDNDRLIKTLLNLRDTGNTIIVVEHDEDTIFASDYIVDIGPGAGVHGGEIVVAGDLEELLTAKKNTSGSVTLAYLRGEKSIEIPDERRSQDKGKIMIRDGNIFNIKNMDVDIPLGRLIMVTGVSGSGKSTFMYEIVHKNLQARFDRRYRTNEVFNCASFHGTEYVGRTVLIDQSAIGRTPRSNPATYTGAFTFIGTYLPNRQKRELEAGKPIDFHSMLKAVRCEACQGNGEIAVEMSFLPTVYVPCDVCDGKRFMKETLEVKYKKKSIYDVLENDG
jgi:excinuclease ABC subunit A